MTFNPPSALLSPPYAPPSAPIATINAIGIITDSDGLLAAVVAGNTVRRPRLLSADDDENE